MKGTQRVPEGRPEGRAMVEGSAVMRYGGGVVEGRMERGPMHGGGPRGGTGEGWGRGGAMGGRGTVAGCREEVRMGRGGMP